MLPDEFVSDEYWESAFYTLALVYCSLWQLVQLAVWLYFAIYYPGSIGWGPILVYAITFALTLNAISDVYYCFILSTDMFDEEFTKGGLV